LKQKKIKKVSNFFRCIFETQKQTELIEKTIIACFQQTIIACLFLRFKNVFEKN